MSARTEKYAEDFAAAMIAAIEKGAAPWQRPWKRGRSPLPVNFRTGRLYSGCNFMYLLAVASLQGYADPRWGGFHQIRRAGGCVRRGERGTPVLIVRTGKGRTEEVPDDDGNLVEEHVRGRMYVAVQHVFNVAQADGLELPGFGDEGPPAWEPDAEARAGSGRHGRRGARTTRPQGLLRPRRRPGPDTCSRTPGAPAPATSRSPSPAAR